MRTLDDLVRAGKIRHGGLSDIPAWYASRAQTIAEVRGLEPICALQMEYSLVERNIEHEFIPLGTRHGMGVMVWSPLASGFLSGKYRPSAEGADPSAGEGRLAKLAGSGNPAFNKFTERNWRILAALETVAGELNRSMAQVAINWAANRPGVASVLVGASKLSQLEDNLGALDFEIPQPLMEQLTAASAPETLFPYSFFTPGHQAMLAGGTALGDKPAGYHPSVRVPAAAPTSVSAD